MLRLDIEVQKRSRLVRNACLFGAGEIEYLLKELRLLIGSGVDLASFWVLGFLLYKSYVLCLMSYVVCRMS